jgi:hypothetical protein
MKRRIKTVSYPYDISEENGFTVLRFIVKDPNAKFPDECKLKLILDVKDKQTLIKELSK